MLECLLKTYNLAKRNSIQAGRLIGHLLEHADQWFIGKSLSEALIFAELGENMLYTEIVLNVKKTKTRSLHVLSLEFSCIELVIQ